MANRTQKKQKYGTGKKTLDKIHFLVMSNTRNICVKAITSAEQRHEK